MTHSNNNNNNNSSIRLSSSVPSGDTSSGTFSRTLSVGLNRVVERMIGDSSPSRQASRALGGQEVVTVTVDTTGKPSSSFPGGWPKALRRRKNFVSDDPPPISASSADSRHSRHNNNSNSNNSKNLPCSSQFVASFPYSSSCSTSFIIDNFDGLSRLSSSGRIVQFSGPSSMDMNNIVSRNENPLNSFEPNQHHQIGGDRQCRRLRMDDQQELDLLSAGMSPLGQPPLRSANNFINCNKGKDDGWGWDKSALIIDTNKSSRRLDSSISEQKQRQLRTSSSSGLEQITTSPNPNPSKTKSQSKIRNLISSCTKLTSTSLLPTLTLPLLFPSPLKKLPSSSWPFWPTSSSITFKTFIAALFFLMQFMLYTEEVNCDDGYVLRLRTETRENNNSSQQLVSRIILPTRSDPYARPIRSFSRGQPKKTPLDSPGFPYLFVNTDSNNKIVDNNKNQLKGSAAPSLLPAAAGDQGSLRRSPRRQHHQHFQQDSKDSYQPSLLPSSGSGSSFVGKEDVPHSFDNNNNTLRQEQEERKVKGRRRQRRAIIPFTTATTATMTKTTHHNKQRHHHHNNYHHKHHRNSSSGSRRKRTRADSNGPDSSKRSSSPSTSSSTSKSQSSSSRRTNARRKQQGLRKTPFQQQRQRQTRSKAPPKTPTTTTTTTLPPSLLLPDIPEPVTPEDSRIICNKGKWFTCCCSEPCTAIRPDNLDALLEDNVTNSMPILYNSLMEEEVARRRHHAANEGKGNGGGKSGSYSYHPPEDESNNPIFLHQQLHCTQLLPKKLKAVEIHFYSAKDYNETSMIDGECMKTKDWRHRRDMLRNFVAERLNGFCESSEDMKTTKCKDITLYIRPDSVQFLQVTCNAIRFVVLKSLEHSKLNGTSVIPAQYVIDSLLDWSEVFKLVFHKEEIRFRQVTLWNPQEPKNGSNNPSAGALMDNKLFHFLYLLTALIVTGCVLVLCFSYNYLR